MAAAAVQPHAQPRLGAWIEDNGGEYGESAASQQSQHTPSSPAHDLAAPEGKSGAGVTSLVPGFGKLADSTHAISRQ